jgi:GT2 family glycosyltransferase
MIYIIIPVHNRKKLTRDCLLSLNLQDMRDFLVIVVDDGSSDGTSEMVETEFPDVILLRGDGNLWWAGAINKGIRFAMDICHPDDYLLTLNDDLIVPPNYLSNLLNAASPYPGAIIGSVETTMSEPQIIKSGGILVNWMTAKFNVLNRGRHLEEFQNGYVVEVSSLTGRGTLFPNRIFREVGLYDELHIKQCADTELPLRANFKHGYPLVVSYDAVVISNTGDKNNINTKRYYSFSDLREFFFGIRSHFNLKNRFWIAYNIAPNNVWLARYLSLTIIRTIGRFVLNLRFHLNL